MMAIEAGPPLRKVTLPTAEAPRLLSLLSMMGISASNLLPGFGGAARGAMEKGLRDRLLK
jgi:hypothetical protein